MILIIGHQGDPHIQAVVACLKQLKAEVMVLDVYSSDSGGIVQKVSNDTLLSIGSNSIEISEINAIWWRQKPKFQFPTDSLGLYDYYFVQREWNTFFDYLSTKTLKCWSINNRVNAKKAENKAIQLELIKEFDFKVPKTILTNRACDAYKFFKTEGIKRCIYKTFSPYIPPNLKIAYTTEVLLEELLNIDLQDTIDSTPGIFQELIVANYELRVTVVDKEIFAVRIDTVGNEKSTDWRESIFDNKYTEVKLSKELEGTLIKYHNKLGLVFAAYDFIVDIHGDTYFLEVNPAGQWMWIEEQLQLPISKSVALTLINYNSNE